ncbi:hypothetical protein [Deinococcus sp. Leaf326]|uniref:hypothetical protein n=1 Tax=Deinococcus sp. Leaf326 TaxID=1736338 RepID=UPI0006F74BD5|nr:hypothetical protein [Deinococcus sp. Leaf326]KQQ99821.1 hypothetical protein ASF71_21910 [Deinococcus sp. Leaf326]
MKRSFVLLVLSVLTLASAKQVTGKVVPGFTFSDGLNKDGYTIAIEVPNTLEAKTSFGKLQVRKSFFEEMKFELYSKIPKNVIINDKSWVIQDTSAKSEVLLLIPRKEGYTFSLYRRLNPAKGNMLLQCRGDADTKSVYDDMLKTCRSAKLR